MIHHTCDCCKRQIDPDDELRFVVRLEVYAAIDPQEDEADDDRDHLREIQEVLERLDDPHESEVCDKVYHQRRFDLCNECRQRFVEDPLGRVTLQSLDFSNN